MKQQAAELRQTNEKERQAAELRLAAERIKGPAAALAEGRRLAEERAEKWHAISHARIKAEEDRIKAEEERVRQARIEAEEKRVRQARIEDRS